MKPKSGKNTEKSLESVPKGVGLSIQSTNPTSFSEGDGCQEVSEVGDVGRKKSKKAGARVHQKPTNAAVGAKPSITIPLRGKPLEGHGGIDGNSGGKPVETAYGTFSSAAAAAAGAKTSTGVGGYGWKVSDPVVALVESGGSANKASGSAAAGAPIKSYAVALASKPSKATKGKQMKGNNGGIVGGNGGDPVPAAAAGAPIKSYAAALASKPSKATKGKQTKGNHGGSLGGNGGGAAPAVGGGLPNMPNIAAAASTSSKTSKKKQIKGNHGGNVGGNGGYPLDFAPSTSKAAAAASTSSKTSKKKQIKGNHGGNVGGNGGNPLDFAPSTSKAAAAASTSSKTSKKKQIKGNHGGNVGGVVENTTKNAASSTVNKAVSGKQQAGPTSSRGGAKKTGELLQTAGWSIIDFATKNMSQQVRAVKRQKKKQSSENPGLVLSKRSVVSTVKNIFLSVAEERKVENQDLQKQDEAILRGEEIPRSSRSKSRVSDELLNRPPLRLPQGESTNWKLNLDSIIANVQSQSEEAPAAIEPMEVCNEDPVSPPPKVRRKGAAAPAEPMEVGNEVPVSSRPKVRRNRAAAPAEPMKISVDAPVPRPPKVRRKEPTPKPPPTKASKKKAAVRRSQRLKARPTKATGVAAFVCKETQIETVYVPKGMFGPLDEIAGDDQYPSRRSGKLEYPPDLQIEQLPPWTFDRLERSKPKKITKADLKEYEEDRKKHKTLRPISAKTHEKIYLNFRNKQLPHNGISNPEFVSYMRYLQLEKHEHLPEKKFVCNDRIVVGKPTVASLFYGSDAISKEDGQPYTRKKGCSVNVSVTKSEGLVLRQELDKGKILAFIVNICVVSPLRSFRSIQRDFTDLNARHEKFYDYVSTKKDAHAMAVIIKPNHVVSLYDCNNDKDQENAVRAMFCDAKWTIVEGVVNCVGLTLRKTPDRTWNSEKWLRAKGFYVAPTYRGVRFPNSCAVYILFCIEMLSRGNTENTILFDTHAQSLLYLMKVNHYLKEMEEDDFCWKITLFQFRWEKLLDYIIKQRGKIGFGIDTINDTKMLEEYEKKAGITPNRVDLGKKPFTI